MVRLRDSSEVQEAATLLGQILLETKESELGSNRGERLERTLALLCSRARFTGAAVADGQGLALAAYNCPYDMEALSAFAAIMGEAIVRAGDTIGHAEADALSLDVNFTDKLVVRRFPVGDQTCLLLVLCPQELDERSEMELSIEQISTIIRPEAPLGRLP